MHSKQGIVEEQGASMPKLISQVSQVFLEYEKVLLFEWKITCLCVSSSKKKSYANVQQIIWKRKLLTFVLTAQPAPYVFLPPFYRQNKVVAHFISAMMWVCLCIHMHIGLKLPVLREG